MKNHIEKKHFLYLQLLKNVKFIPCYLCNHMTAGRTRGGSIQYWQWQEASKLLREEGQKIQEEAHGAVIVTARSDAIFATNGKCYWPSDTVHDGSRHGHRELGLIFSLLQKKKKIIDRWFLAVRFLSKLRFSETGTPNRKHNNSLPLQVDSVDQLGASVDHGGSFGGLLEPYIWGADKMNIFRGHRYLLLSLCKWR